MSAVPTCNDLLAASKLKALKSEFSVELLDRMRGAQSRALQDLLETHLQQNSKVLISEKMEKFEKLISLEISQVTVAATIGSVPESESVSNSKSEAKSSALHEYQKDLTNYLKKIYVEIHSLLEIRSNAIFELEQLHLQKAKRIFVSFEAELWTEYYQELSEARKNQTAFDDALVDSSEDELPCLVLEDEVQSMLKSTQKNIEETEKLKLKKSIFEVDNLFREKIREFISGLDQALENLFNQLDIVTQVSVEASQRRKSASQVIIQIEGIKNYLESLTAEFTIGLDIMNSHPLSDRSKSFIDIDEPHNQQLWSIFGSTNEMKTGLIHEDLFISAAKQWLLNIKEQASLENILLEKCSKNVNNIKSLLKSSKKSICRFSDSGNSYEKRPSSITEKENTISRKVFQEFYPSLREIQ